ncbi:hypothetical protein [Oenococcus sicerae]|uniref:Uncharacterized protein n=1 Tax=Oenococcus sicerae TaxID=2203724 RepID=A0AAJ1R9V9_9LACO|nr:hypothetical protein [Oenococcus sicerae]MDN6900175.1 hypothetical protein [Oenococcus sicerae]
MDKVNFGLRFAILSVMVLLTFLMQARGHQAVYFFDYEHIDIFSRLFFFGLLLVSFLPIIGSVKKWETGAMLNQSIRYQTRSRLLVKSYLRNAIILIANPVIILLADFFVFKKTFLWERFLALIMGYVFYTSLYMLFELLFSSGAALLIISAILLLALLAFRLPAALAVFF